MAARSVSIRPGSRSLHHSIPGLEPKRKQTDLNIQRPVILYNQDPGIPVSLLRSTCRHHRVSIPTRRPTRPAPRTWRSRAVLPGGFAAAPGVSIRYTVRLSRRRSTVRLRATDRWGYLMHPGPLGRQDRCDRPFAGRHAQGTQGRSAPYCPLRPVSRTLVPAALKRLRRSGFAASASRQRLRRGASR